MIDYPKPVMRLGEMRDVIGIPEEMLMRAYRTKGQKFAQKMDPKKRNSPIIFITEGFERWREEQQALENKAVSGR